MDPMKMAEITMDDKSCIKQTAHCLMRILMLMGCRREDAISISTNMMTPKDAVYQWADWQEKVMHYLTEEFHYNLSSVLPLRIAHEVITKKSSFIILLGGTSGCGKSTLASILAAKLGLNTVWSTDSIRQVLREVLSKEDVPHLFVSTYIAGEYVEDVSGGDAASSSRSLKQRQVLKGYKSQSAVVVSRLEKLIASAEARKESLVIEGVHLTPDQMTSLVKKYRSCIPFVIHISNPQKHRERFAIRAKDGISTDPAKNKYIKYFDNISIIQSYICKCADKHLIPKIDNTNVDRSVATIHSTLIRVLTRIKASSSSSSSSILDGDDKFVVLSQEHEATIEKAWSSSAMQKAIKPYLKQNVAKNFLLKDSDDDKCSSDVSSSSL